MNILKITMGVMKNTTEVLEITTGVLENKAYLLRKKRRLSLVGCKRGLRPLLLPLILAIVTINASFFPRNIWIRLKNVVPLHAV